MADLLDKIDYSTKFVSYNSRYVSINYKRIDTIIEGGEFNKISYWLENNPFGLLDLGYRKVINFLLLYHTIGNFCFWGNLWAGRRPESFWQWPIRIPFVLFRWKFWLIALNGF